jgi:hypothetical protein
MFDPGQKRLLALDGGGIMGVITLQLLQRIEDQLRPLSGKGDDFVLADFFDYFGGTSTGAIIATGLAMGKPVSELAKFYDDAGKDMFQKAGLIHRLFHKFTEKPLVDKLREVIGTDTILQMLDGGAIRSQLLVVTRSANTDSAWPLTVNRRAKFNDTTLSDCNLRMPLWQLVRASTAAPTYFRPELINLGNHTRQFVDGGITPYNSPAFLLYKKATLPQYKLCWPSGEDRMMMVSLGTGYTDGKQEPITARGRWLLGNAAKIPSELMRGIARENDMNCRMVGRCVHGPMIDSEVGSMTCPLDKADWLGKSFLYARYDADISKEGLNAAGLGGIDPASLQMDNVASMPDLKRIGIKAADQIDMLRHFHTFLKSAPATAV